eukprot:Lankesteria_metandrocarpae@DN407_c0_g1_i2.p1
MNVSDTEIRWTKRIDLDAMIIVNLNSLHQDAQTDANLSEHDNPERQTSSYVKPLNLDYYNSYSSAIDEYLSKHVFGLWTIAFVCPPYCDSTDHQSSIDRYSPHVPLLSIAESIPTDGDNWLSTVPSYRMAAQQSDLCFAGLSDWRAAQLRFSCDNANRMPEVESAQYASRIARVESLMKRLEAAQVSTQESLKGLHQGSEGRCRNKKSHRRPAAVKSKKPNRESRNRNEMVAPWNDHLNPRQDRTKPISQHPKSHFNSERPANYSSSPEAMRPNGSLLSDTPQRRSLTDTEILGIQQYRRSRSLPVVTRCTKLCAVGSPFLSTSSLEESRLRFAEFRDGIASVRTNCAFYQRKLKNFDSPQRRHEHEDGSEVEDMRKKLNNRLTELNTVSVMLWSRRRRMLLELQKIFPIEHLGFGSYSIKGEYLPSLPSLQTLDCRDEASVACAIGYLTQLVVSLSKVLGVQLPFTTTAAASLSTISFDSAAVQNGSALQFLDSAALSTIGSSSGAGTGATTIRLSCPRGKGAERRKALGALRMLAANVDAIASAYGVVPETQFSEVYVEGAPPHPRSPAGTSSSTIGGSGESADGTIDKLQSPNAQRDTTDSSSSGQHNSSSSGQHNSSSSGQHNSSSSGQHNSSSSGQHNSSSSGQHNSSSSGQHNSSS